MGHLIIDSKPLELYAWIDPEIEFPGWDVLTDNPFGQSLPEDEFSTTQNYFAEYHLEYHRQRYFDWMPSRLHSLLLFATRVDAKNFQQKHPARLKGKSLVCARTSGSYTVSFHDASFLDYLRLPHSLSLSEMNEVSEYYWQGALSEESDLKFMDEYWWEIPVIEAIFQGKLAASLLTWH